MRRALLGGAMVAVLAASWARHRFMLVTVKGSSMAPTYHDGERLIVRRGGYRVGDVVMFRPPADLPHRLDWMVKRAVAIAGDQVPADLADRAGVAVVPPGRLLVRSDSPHGLDSRQLGLIDGRDVIGVVAMSRGLAELPGPVTHRPF
jgi:signal peptidase I